MELYVVSGYWVEGYAAGDGGQEAASQRDADIPWNKFVPEFPQVEEIEEVLEQEAAKPRPKTRKVKREIAQQIIDLSNVGGLLGEKIPPAVYRQIERAVDAFDTQADQTLIYAAIRIALIRAAEEAEEEDDMMAILMVA
jgi:hypothetical protein